MKCKSSCFRIFRFVFCLFSSEATFRSNEKVKENEADDLENPIFDYGDAKGSLAEAIEDLIKQGIED